MKDTKLNNKQKNFCKNYTNTGNIRESAFKAGYINNPEKHGFNLLNKKEILQEIQENYEQKKRNLIYRACSGYERLAFGSITDAIKLIYTEKPNLNLLETFDLFNISEIKKPKDGSLEIKFFDRLKALEKLQTLDLENKDKQVPFYEALERSIKPG